MNACILDPWAFAQRFTCTQFCATKICTAVQQYHKTMKIQKNQTQTICKKPDFGQNFVHTFFCGIFGTNNLHEIHKHGFQKANSAQILYNTAAQNIIGCTKHVCTLHIFFQPYNTFCLIRYYELGYSFVIEFTYCPVTHSKRIPYAHRGYPRRKQDQTLT